ncbi:hypothetical protein [Candidatus Vondammii sp. HM_W22]|uniref:hypothetical protein n=1 Tax=Candidatus Vondammii sp. HM_W22 TaxID=2687299 RepID=UPI00403E1FA2
MSQLPSLGVDVRFTIPAHDQSKPIGRAFRDLRQTIDKHPKFGKWAPRTTHWPLRSLLRSWR